MSGNPQITVQDTGATTVPLTPRTSWPFSAYRFSRGGRASRSVTPALPPTPKTYNDEGGYYSSDPFKDPPDPHAQSTGLRPFLSLGPRLLLTTFSPALLPFVFTIVHIAQTRASTAQLAATLRSSLMSACSGLATGASSLQALPRYLAMQTNDQVLRATRASVLAVGIALMDCITIIEQVLNFIVDTYRSLLLCTVYLVVQGTLEILIAAVEEISTAVTSSLNSIREEIQSDIASANNLVQGAVSAINSVTSLIDVNLSVPNMTIPALSFLENVTIPTGFEDTLIKLNTSMPTLDELKDKINELIDTPFEMLKNEINTTRLEIAANLNDSAFPVPSLTTLGAQDASSLQSALCGDLNTSLIDDTASALHKLGTWGIVAMVLILLGGWGVLAFWQWRRWRALQDTVVIVETEWASARPTDAWATVAVVEHPFLERYARPVLNKMNASPRTRNNLRWLLSYLGHPTMLTLFCMAVVGLIAIEIQMVALHAIQHRMQESANATIAATTDDLVARLNALSADASASYAKDMNAAISTVQDSMNNDLFGSWVNTTAVTLNSTLVTFYSEVETVLNASFGGTILYNPINTFVYCILGSKITNLEKGLTWVSEHAYIDLPTIDPNVLQLSNASMLELVAPISAAAAGTSNDPNEGVIADLVNHFQAALAAERTIYAILLAVYAVLVLIGLLVVVWNSGGREHYFAWRSKGPPPPPEGPSGEKDGQWPGGAVVDYAGEKASGGRHTPGQDSGLNVASPPSRQGSSAGRGSLRSLAAPGNAFLAMRSYVSTPLPAQSRSSPAPVPPAPASPEIRGSFGPFLDPVAPPVEQAYWLQRVTGGVGAYLRALRPQPTPSESSFGASRAGTARTPHFDIPFASPAPLTGEPPSTPLAGSLEALGVAARWRRSGGYYAAGTPIPTNDVRRLVVMNAHSQDAMSVSDVTSVTGRSLPPPPRAVSDFPTDAVSPISSTNHGPPGPPSGTQEMSRANTSDHYLSADGHLAVPSTSLSRSGSESGPSAWRGTSCSSSVGRSASRSTHCSTASHHQSAGTGMAAWGSEAGDAADPFGRGGADDVELVDSERGSYAADLNDGLPSGKSGMTYATTFSRPSRASGTSFGGGGRLSLNTTPACSAPPSLGPSPARPPAPLPSERDRRNSDPFVTPLLRLGFPLSPVPQSPMALSPTSPLSPSPSIATASVHGAKVATAALAGIISNLHSRRQRDLERRINPFVSPMDNSASRPPSGNLSLSHGCT